VWELAHALDVARILSDSLREELVLTGKARLLEPGGERVLELFASPLRDGEGRVTGSVVVLHDVTRLRRLEEVRRDFVANASHELKTPIAAILGLVETLLEDGEEVPAEMRSRFLGRIRHQSQRLSALVQDLIALSRLESRDRADEREAVEVGRVAADAFHSLAPAAEAKGLDYSLESPDEEVRILASERDLREAVENLLDNAVKYTPEKGRVSLVVSCEDGEAVITVADDGIGIPPELHDRVFERFYRVDQARSREVGGTGLGLAIVRNVTQSLGGTVSLESAPGAGSRFTLRFPVVTEARLGS
jgi:two-component system phosphate regulon sensor histidine kinase PhoR